MFVLIRVIRVYLWLTSLWTSDAGKSYHAQAVAPEFPRNGPIGSG
jgi:hypothetical protein